MDDASMATSEAEAESSSARNHACDDFPMGLSVLAVDDDVVCLSMLQALLEQCGYKVSATQFARTALQMLRENKDKYDIIITDVHMPDMDGFKLLQMVGLEMDLPVIMLSVSSDVEVVMKGIRHGACDHLVKPVRVEELRLIWKHMIKKSLDSTDKSNNTAKSEDDQSKKLTRKKEDGPADNNLEEDMLAQKKSRIAWNHELHTKFIEAVNYLGVDRAVPKKILEYMNTPGLTRENIASHLQKYRKALKKNNKGKNQEMHSGINGFDGFSGNASSSMVMPFDEQASDDRSSLENFGVNGYTNYQNTVPFTHTINPLFAQPWTPLPVTHQDVLPTTSQVGNIQMQHPGYALNSSMMERSNPQFQPNELNNQSHMIRSNQIDDYMANASQRVWTSDRGPRLNIVPQLGNSANENPFGTIIVGNSSHHADLGNSFSSEFNLVLTLPHETHNAGESARADLHWGAQRNGVPFEMQSSEGGHIRVTGRPEVGNCPVAPTGTLFQFDHCNSDDDFDSVLKQFQQ